MEEEGERTTLREGGRTTSRKGGEGGEGATQPPHARDASQTNTSSQTAPPQTGLLPPEPMFTTRGEPGGGGGGGVGGGGGWRRWRK